MNKKDNDYDIKGYVREYLPLVDGGSWPLVFQNPNTNPPALSYPLLWSCSTLCADNFCTSVKDSLNAIVHSLLQAMPNNKWRDWKAEAYTTFYDDARLPKVPIALGYDGEIHWHEGNWVPYLYEHYDGIRLRFNNLLPFTIRMKLERLGPEARANMQQNMWRDMYSILQSAIGRENITAENNNMQYRYRIIGLRSTNDGNSMVIHLRYFGNKENTNSRAFRGYYPPGVTNDYYLVVVDMVDTLGGGGGTVIHHPELFAPSTPAIGLHQKLTGDSQFSRQQRQGFTFHSSYDKNKSNQKGKANKSRITHTCQAS